jgi:hypothetical protein
MWGVTNVHGDMSPTDQLNEDKVDHLRKWPSKEPDLGELTQRVTYHFWSAKLLVVLH